MSWILRSYLKYTRGESSGCLWNLLWPLQFGVKTWMHFRMALYSRGIFAVGDPILPTVSVGNNSLGGTNKTPMVEYIVKQFAEAGIKAGVVSRGYRTKEHPSLWIGQDENSKRRDFAGDEPLMLAHHLPDSKVVVSRKRFEGVKLLAALGMEVAVTDDTFQHRKMARDVDIVLVDATTPFGNGNVIPAGLMREPMSAFSRADIIVLTKANQSTPENVNKTKEILSRYVTPDKIFTADIILESWAEITANGEKKLPAEFRPEGHGMAMSAIGNPIGFYSFLEELGVDTPEHKTFRDHETLSYEELKKLDAAAAEKSLDFFCCTEKDLMNMPQGFVLSKPLYVPCIAVSVANSLEFRKKICEALHPAFLVTSNGHGEDAIGVVLAKKLKERFPSAQIDAFAFVGSGKQYKVNGINVISPSIDMPSGGVIKYNARDLLGDMCHGLGSSIGAQHKVLRSLAGYYRTPVCVGDVYLLASVLWGQGIMPILVATAKTVHLSGHMVIEKFLLKHRSILTWTRDMETAKELTESGVDAVFYGNPIMDLLDDVEAPAFIWEENGFKVLLLPGSRPRAYDDVKLVLDAAAALAKRVECNFAMVLAATLDIEKMADTLTEWKLNKKRDTFSNGTIKVKICYESVAAAAYGAELLIGLGGTANQLCAGLGIPVVSIYETGKLRQKKLLREAEILVDANADALASAAEKILKDRSLRNAMQEAGIKNLGRTGALEKVAEYCDEDLGWGTRCRVYEKYKKYLSGIDNKK